MKKLIVILTVLSLFLLSGCGKKIENKEENKPVQINENEIEQEEKEEVKEEKKPFETSYDGVVEKSKLVDKIGDFSIYNDEDVYGSNSYILNDNTKSIIVFGEFQGVAISEEFELNDNVEGTCCLEYPKNCDYYVYNLGFKSYFISKKDNVISSKSYNYIGCYYSNDGNSLGLCKDNLDVVIVQNTSSINPDGSYDSIFGLLNTKTGFEYIEPKFEELRLLSKDKLAGKLNGKVGLYKIDGTEILKPEYSYIGVFTTNNEKTYVTIKDNEIKIFDENMKSKKLNVNSETIMNGVGDDYIASFQTLIKADVSSNDYFKYTGTDIKGEKYIAILKLGCGDFDEEIEKYVDSKDSVIFVIDNGGLKKLDPILVDQDIEICGMDF